jgi:hypothetical protein
MVAGVLRLPAQRGALPGVLALAVLCGRALCVGAAASESDLPPDISAADTMQLLRINGLDVRSRALTSALAPDAACALLERQWQVSGNGGPPIRCQRVGVWFVITHRAGEVLQTAQLQARNHGSVGFMSAVDPFALPSERPRATLPLPAGARVLNVVQSIEAGDSVTQFTLLLPMPPAVALLRLRTAAREHGWNWAQADSGGVIDFQRGAIAVRAFATRTALGTGLVLVEHKSSRVQP